MTFQMQQISTEGEVFVQWTRFDLNQFRVMVFDEQFIMSWYRVQSGGLVERQAHALPQVRDRAKGGEESQRGGGWLPGCRLEHEPFILHVRQFDRYPKPYLSEMCRQASRGRTSGQIYCPIKCAVLYLPKFPSLGTTLITWTERNFQSAWQMLRDAADAALLSNLC